MIKRSLLLAAAVIAASIGTAGAQQYPDKGLNFIVPYPPGGPSNLMGRAIAKGMEQDLGKPITVINRSGGGGTVGVAEIARSAADGYTIGMAPSTPLLMKPHTTKLPYDISSFDLICRAFDNPLILTVSAKSSIKNLDDFLKTAKAKNGLLKFYSEGPGSLQDIAMSELQAKAGFKAIGVPMKGNQAAIQNLLSGVIDVAPITSGIVLSNPDLLRPIASMSAEKLQKPDVPTLSSRGYNVVYSLMGAVVAPKGLGKAKYDRLVKACASAQKSADFLTMMDKFHMPHVTETGEGFAKAVTAQYNAIGDYMKAHGMSPK